MFIFLKKIAYINNSVTSRFIEYSEISEKNYYV